MSLGLVSWTTGIERHRFANCINSTKVLSDKILLSVRDKDGERRS